MRQPIILVIEDTEDIAELLGESLRNDDKKVILATNLTEALFKLGNQKFDCIVSDIMLEASTVEPVLKELTKKDTINYNTPVLLHSAYITHDIIDRNKSIIKGAFVKPTSFEIILKRLNSVI